MKLLNEIISKKLRNYLFPIILSLGSGNHFFAQCIPPMSEICDTAHVLCSLDQLNGYTCANSSTTPNPCSPLCSQGGVGHNTSWWAFVTQGGNITLSLSIGGCVTSQGLQFGIWEDCSCGTEILCRSIPCVPPGAEERFTVNLQACKMYYLWVDGCSGDVCDFTLSTQGGGIPQMNDLKKINNIDSEKISVCEGACDVSFFVPVDSNGCEPYFIWELGTKEVGRQKRSIKLSFPDTGVFKLCATAVIGNPSTGSICSQPSKKCIEITVNPKSGVISGPARQICYYDLPYAWGNTVVTANGEYKSQFIDSTNCCIFDSLLTFVVIDDGIPPCIRKPYIKGKVFLDQNNNRTYDTLEDILSNRLILNSPSQTISFSNKLGYTLFLDSGQLNSITAPLPLPKFYDQFPDNYLVKPLNGFGQVPGNFDFAVVNTDSIDLEVHLACSQARRGFGQYPVYISIKNLGGSDAIGFKLELAFPSNWVFESSTRLTPTQIQGNKIFFEYMDKLSPNADLQFICYFTVPQTTNIGTPYEFLVEVSNPEDLYKEDNISKCGGRVTGSYDPNDKAVNKTFVEDTLTPYKELIYTIRFQNTGNDTAFTVFIRDTLDPLLDARSIRLLQSSHTCQLTGDQLGIYELIFNDILLPDSTTDNLGSQGFAQFSVTTTPSFYSGKIIKNSASIYFDNNEPVHTNVVTTEYLIVSNKDFHQGGIDFEVYPNPFGEELIVKFNELRDADQFILEVTDPRGSSLVQYKVSEGVVLKLDTQSWSSGIYHLLLKTTQQRVVSSKEVLKY
ncbi:MAG: T9SS type A sorting domain-containing protein [Saprospiraceae bacterium]|nr:T9SS type A sorting domain-containing protein [Saprospiraceae bacterium]